MRVVCFWSTLYFLLIKNRIAMNTVFEYLNMLPDNIRDRAMKQTSRNRLTLLAGTMTGALRHAFSWKYSEEGEKFWMAVCNCYDNRRPHFNIQTPTGGMRAPSHDELKDNQHTFPL